MHLPKQRGGCQAGLLAPESQGALQRFCSGHMAITHFPLPWEVPEPAIIVKWSFLYFLILKFGCGVEHLAWELPSKLSRYPKYCTTLYSRALGLLHVGDLKDSVSIDHNSRFPPQPLVTTIPFFWFYELTTLDSQSFKWNYPSVTGLFLLKHSASMVTGGAGCVAEFPSC